MSGTFPNTNYIGLNFRSSQPSLVSETVSGIKFIRQPSAQRFLMTLSFPPQTRSNFGSVLGFILKQRGQKESFLLPLPDDLKNARGTASGSPTATGSAGSTTLTLAGTGTGSLLSGDLIKLDHDKLYMVVEDASDISSGNTLTIEPPLTQAVSGASLSFDNISMTVRLINDVQEFPVSRENHYRFELDVEEVVS